MENTDEIGSAPPSVCDAGRRRSGRARTAGTLGPAGGAARHSSRPCGRIAGHDHDDQAGTHDHGTEYDDRSGHHNRFEYHHGSGHDSRAGHHNRTEHYDPRSSPHPGATEINPLIARSAWREGLVVPRRLDGVAVGTIEGKP